MPQYSLSLWELETLCMSMIGNRVQSLSHEVGRIIVRWEIGKDKGLADAMFSWEGAGYVDVLSLRFVARVLSNMNARRIICHNRHGDSVTELCECVEVPDCLMRCSGKCHIFCFGGSRGNRLLFLRESGYRTTILHKSVTRYGTTGITTRSITRAAERKNGQRNWSRRGFVIKRHGTSSSKITNDPFDCSMMMFKRMRRKTRQMWQREG